MSEISAIPTLMHRHRGVCYVSWGDYYLAERSEAERAAWLDACDEVAERCLGGPVVRKQKRERIEWHLEER